MVYEAKAIQIMMASPSDVQNELEEVRRIIHDWNDINAAFQKVVLLPVHWKTNSSPEMGDRGQAIINKQVQKDSDILVAVFWTRLGTPTGTQASGTVEEIMEHTGAGKKTMIYFSNQPVVMGSVDRNEYDRLIEFKKWCSDNGLIREYSDIDEFKRIFYKDLSLTMARYFSTDNAMDSSSLEATIYTVQPPYPEAIVNNRRKGDPDLSNEAIILLIEAAKDPNGVIIKSQTIGSFHVSTNHNDYVGNNDPRSRAKWGGAVDELYEFGLIKAEGYKREVFTVTTSGYELADWLCSNLDIESLKQNLEGLENNN